MAIKLISKPSVVDEKQNFHCNWSINNEKQFTHKFDHPYINAYHEIIETTKR